jgi:hypothetical protein
LGCPDPAETYSSSPHLYEELSIPTEATGNVGPARASSGPARKESKRVTTGDGEKPARRNTRARRRTRGGQSADGHVDAAEQTTPAAQDGTESVASESSDSPRRRRRRRPRKAAATTAS